ncbi:MAG TPA: PAS domain S-box protein [Syntrophaceae bacterium]|nr:PAS domain S-box protein [Syntrophaceae bacterium]
MAEHPNMEQNKSLKKNLQWLMALRVIITTFLLGATAYIQIRERYLYLFPSLDYIYIFISFTYFLTIVYGFLLSKIKNLRAMAYQQILGDVVLTTILIYITGGTESIFSFVYLFSVISASMILYRRGGLIVASMSTILFGLLLNLEYYGVLIPLGRKGIEYTVHDAHYFFYLLGMNMAAFYLVAILSSHISQRLKEVEAELERKKIDYSKLEALYRDIVENVESGLISLDRDGHIGFLNKAGEDILGYRFDELYKESVSKIFPWIDLKRKGQLRGEAIFKKKDGKDIFLGFSISPSRDIGGKVMVFQDITKVKEMEEQVMRSEKLAAIGELAAGIAHEIRNPIASISGSTEILKEELGGSNHLKPLMDIILREADRLNRLVTDFLQFSKPALPQKEVFPLKDLINETLLSLRGNPDWNQDVKVEVQIPNSLSLYGDSGQLRQVFLNLFLNAVQAMPHGGILHISALNRDGLVEVSVQDTGLGIPQEIKGKIFDPFFTTKENGTGLGLTIVHQIIKNHQGEIQVKSEFARGTKVTLRLLSPH